MRGVLASVLSMINGGARYMAVATDHVIESFRNGLWPGYKTGAGIEPELLAQFPLLEEALSALGIVVWPMVEFEADDALASAAAKAALDPRADRVIICTPDKDLAQCVRGTRVVQMNRRTRTVFDEAGIVAKFGVPPVSIPDYLALVGDAADGYPGLRGWGAKSSAAVLGDTAISNPFLRTGARGASTPPILARWRSRCFASAIAHFSFVIWRHCAATWSCSTQSTTCTGTVRRPRSLRSPNASIRARRSPDHHSRKRLLAQFRRQVHLQGETRGLSMRLASALAVLVLLTVWHPETTARYATATSLIAETQNAPVAPPPPHNFGSDTYRTHVFTGRRITRAGLTCGVTSTGGRICTGFLPSAVDRSLLDVTLMIPTGSGLHPLVTLLHGWGGSKSGSGDIADALVTDGHAVLRYSARGFGRSWGQVNLADVHVEMRDLRSLIGQIVDRQELQIDPDAIAIMGTSYGGGQSWLALVRPTFRSPRGSTVRIRTVVPIVPWTDLLYSLVPNGRTEHSLEPIGSPKLSYINGLFVSGLRRSPGRPYPNYPPYLVGWNAWFNGVEPNDTDPVYRRIIDGVAGYRSIWWQREFWSEAAQNRVPVFQVQGLTDDLFPLPEAKRMMLALRAIDPLYPIASYFADLGHPRASNKPAEVAYLLGLIRGWLAYYLQGVGPEPAHTIRAAITRPRAHPFSPLDVITVADYDALATRIVAKEFGGNATLVNPVSDPYGGFYWDPLVMEAARELRPYTLPPESAVSEASLAVYTVPVADLAGGSALLIAGQPTVSLRSFTLAPRVQLNVRLVDVAPDGTRHLVTRGTHILDSAETADVVIQTYGNLWEAAPDHLLQLEISNLDSPYITPSRVPSVTHLSEVRLELPVR